MAQPKECESAKLKISNKLIACEILDESAGGYLISGKRFPKTPANLPIELHTSAGRQALRVVWRRKVDDEVRIGLQRLPDDFLWHQDSSWIIWMMCAIIVGFGGGYLFAFRDQPMNIADQIAVMSGKRVNNSLVTESLTEPVDSDNATDK
jgi:hypothetical protein